jgi:thioredoxin-like negative regulator of GroEL
LKKNNIKTIFIFLAFTALLFTQIIIAEDIDSENESLIINPQTKLEISKLVHEAQGLLRAKRWKEAESIAKQIQQKSPSSVESYYIRGSIYFYNNDFTKSKAELDSGLKFNATHDPSLFLIGMIFAKKNNWEKAQIYFEKTCNAADYNPFYRYNLAVSYFVNGNYEKSKDESIKTITLKENFFKARLLQIRSLLKLEKKQDALWIAKEMVEKNQEINEATQLYSELLLKEGNYQEVIKLLSVKKTYTLSEKKSLAFAYLKEGETNKALQLFKQFVSPEKDSEEDAMGYIECLIFSSREEEAEKYLQSLIKISPELKKSYITTFNRLKEKKSLSNDLYQPYPW